MANLASNAFTTVSRLASFLNKTVAEGSSTETQYILYINSVTRFIIDYIGYDPKQQERSEELDSNGEETLFLDAYPVSESVDFTLEVRTSGENEDEWDSVDSEEYHVEYDTGIIYGAGRRKFRSGRKKYKATYTAGFDYDNSTTFLGDTEGANLEMAAWMLAGQIIDRGATGGGIESESIGDYRVKYKSAMFQNDEIKGLLDPFLRANDGLLGTVLTPLHY